ncbi:SURF1 family cytochrome oxidase biogenesis protein [Canibacter zhoujuaniae]|uniref:SURF1 family cytochrome oxidase biogenesis protein n=1 Tax=Canibacter zhoujuaniae TaxID=2708343 RepID=UPI001422DEE8|nr:SURF1 family cytochrome oxidase biogenesis protein [Canibacter zhoujuaniae]
MTSAPAAPKNTKRPRYSGEPTLGQIMRRPKWIFALILVLSVASGFAWLAQWQLGNAITLDDKAQIDTETVIPLAELVEPAQPLNDVAAGHRVSIKASLVPNEFVIVGNRANSGAVGYWVVTQAYAETAAAEHDTQDLANLAVAIGWAATADEAAAAIEKLEAAGISENRTLYEGRLNPLETPGAPEMQGELTVYPSVVPAQLLNLWQNPLPKTYAGYVVLETDNGLREVSGLQAIDSIPPTPPETVNWINLFYGLEWVLFAGFAVYFWVRLCRDAHEREHELKLQEEEKLNG